MNAKAIALRASIAGVLNVALWWFDRAVEASYIPAIAGLGFLKGLGAMMIFSFLVCWLLLSIYDWVCTRDASHIRSTHLRALVEATNDVLGYETVKGIIAETWEGVLSPISVAREHEEARMGLRRFLETIRNLQLRLWEPIRKLLVAPVVRWAIRHHAETSIRYVVLSLFTDGMTTTIAMRPAHSHRMGPREWALFIPSVILSCLGWGVFVSGLVYLFKILVSLIG